MKKLILLISILGLFYSCNHKIKSDKSSLATKPDTFLLHRFNENIPVDEAKKMVANYAPGTVQRAGIGGVMTPTSNSKCVWFDIKTLATLVGEITKEHGDGVRIYFATYDNNTTGYDSGGNPLDYSNLNTLVIVSTKDSISNNISYHSDYYGSAHSIYKSRYFLADPTNKGELCPPPVKCETIGAYLLKP